MSGELIGFVTAPEGKGGEIARLVVQEKLAACVNVLSSVRSIYFWQGKIEDEREELLIIKTGSECWKKLEARIKEIHPYELPEIICFRVEDGYHPYLEWLKSNLSV